MRYYATASGPRVRDTMAAGLLGMIATPAAGNTVPAGVDWCADNGCFTPGRYPGDTAYLRWLTHRRDRAGRCAFATAPDVPFNASATLDRAPPMLEQIRAAGYPSSCSRGRSRSMLASRRRCFTTRASMPYEVRVCGPAPGLVSGGDGLSYHVADGLDALAWADIVFIPGYRFPDRDDPPRVVVDALVAAHERSARLAAISTGAFALAATGLLDGRRATTHWHYTRALAESTRPSGSTRTCCSSTRAAC